MGKVSNILRAKGDIIYTITPDTMVFNALEIMFEKNVSALVVMEGEKLAGIFTERDYARKVILQGKASKDTLISEVMTEDLITVSPDEAIVISSVFPLIPHEIYKFHMTVRHA